MTVWSDFSRACSQPFSDIDVYDFNTRVLAMAENAF